jgi:DNA-binding transcriptional ArsR family regulator
VRQKIAQQLTAASWNDAQPLFGVFFERLALKGIDLIFYKAGNGHGCYRVVDDANSSRSCGMNGSMKAEPFLLKWRYTSDSLPSRQSPVTSNQLRSNAMKSGPNLSYIAALIGDRARADMLSALMSGKALTATELAQAAGVTKQTASAHLAKLSDRQLVALEKQGRHRYFRLADDDVAQVLESLLGVAQRVGATRLQTGPNEPALRYARVCYDHLAGDVGVMLFESLQQRGMLRVVGEGAELTTAGTERMKQLGIDVVSLANKRRPLCRVCLDWSVRRHHLAGALGAAILDLCFDRRWAKRIRHSRVVTFTAPGALAMKTNFGVRISN